MQVHVTEQEAGEVHRQRPCEKEGIVLVLQGEKTQQAVGRRRA